MKGWSSRLYATDRARDFDHERDRNVRSRQIYQTIDRQPLQWVVVLVAGIGFFLDGYTLFASNIALPMIAFVYWNQEVSSLKLTCINIATLAGTLLGQVLFGVLADKYGRKKMYGFELVLVIVATLGVTMSSTGANDSMSVFAWLIWWRILSGIGVGADYPLSGIITSEFAPKKHRARMMAAVFFMQPLGQICGNLVSLLVVVGTRNRGIGDITKAVDIMWRWVVGIGVIPGVIALIFRVAIPETPRFLLDIEDDVIKAVFDTTDLYGEPSMDTELDSRAGGSPGDPWVSSSVGRSMDEGTASRSSIIPGPFTDLRLPNAPMATLNSKWTHSKADIMQYFWKEGNWRSLLATSLCWLLLDFGFYGIGLSNPHSLAKTWGHDAFKISNPSPIWMTNDDPNASVYTMFMNTSIQALIILNVGSFAGGLLLIVFANRLNRVSLQKYGFLFLSVIFIVLGNVFITMEKTGSYAIVLYVVGQMAFNCGPNATTYIIPAEIFPTRYRASCHGISAGMGKLGSILVQIFSAYYKLGSTSPGQGQTRTNGAFLIVFAFAMVLGAIITHFWIPQVQEIDATTKKLTSKSLETLAQGRLGNMSHSITRRRRQSLGNIF